jgi:predicted NBD/HSP70 family sugar kinase
MIFRFEKQQYPGIHRLLSVAEFCSVLGMHESGPTNEVMTIEHALSEREVNDIEAKLVKLTDAENDAIVDAMEAEDPQIEALLNNWAEYAGLI